MHKIYFSKFILTDYELKRMYLRTTKVNSKVKIYISKKNIFLKK